METNQLSFTFATQPKPVYRDFPIKSEAELAEIRAAAAKKFAHLPRPSGLFDTPWAFSRRVRN